MRRTRAPKQIIPSVRMEDIERALEYVQGCIELAGSRSTDLSRDFRYVDKKIEAAGDSTLDRGLRIAIAEAVQACARCVGESKYEAAAAALDVALAALRRAVPRSTVPPRIQPRP